jgi:HSP20 family molecular chaperone IbpA
MPRTTWFDSPFLLGFDRMQDLIERAAHLGAEGGYPPYNVEDRGDGAVRVTLAVAGFKPEDLGVEFDGRQLVITGDQVTNANGEDRAFVHRGIAARRFSRTFVLADGMEVEGASLENGLLHVDVRRREIKRDVKRIEITSTG